MTQTTIREAIDRTASFLADNPSRACVPNAPATATLQGGLRCEVTGPAGEKLVTDMPRGIGGEASGPNPGWLMRAGLASCNATCIALRAAAQGIELSTLEVTVVSDSDTRGMLGLDESVGAGLQNLKVRVRIGAPGHSAEALEALARWACAHSPVGCTDARAAAVEVAVVEPAGG